MQTVAQSNYLFREEREDQAITDRVSGPEPAACTGPDGVKFSGTRLNACPRVDTAPMIAQLDVISSGGS